MSLFKPTGPARLFPATEEAAPRRWLIAAALVGLPLLLTLLFTPLFWWYTHTVKAPRLPGWCVGYLVVLYAVYLYRLVFTGVFRDEAESLTAGRRRLWSLAAVCVLTLGVAFGTHLAVGLRTYSLWWANLATVALSLLVLWYGLNLALPRFDAARFMRGRQIMPLEEARLKAGPPPGIPWGGVLVPLTDATTHFMVVGALGSGKTVTIHAIMKTVLPALGGADCQRALIYDPKRDVLSFLGALGLTVESGRVLVLNPFDQRSAAWDIAADIADPDAADEAATILCPLEEHSANRYFSDAARDIVAQVMRTFIELAPGKWTLRDVVLAASNSRSLSLVLGQTPEGRDLLDEHAEAPLTWANVRGSLSTKLRPHRAIAALWHRAAQRVSLESWFAGDSILVLGSSQRSGEALRAVNRVLFRRLAEIAIDQQEDQEARTWFFIDEAKDAGNLEGLGSLLTKGRSKGMCVVLGFQDLEGMQAVYGDHEAMSLIGQCEQRAVLRVGSTQTAQWAASLFGESEVLEPQVTQEHHGLLGSRLSSTQRREKRDAVLDSEIMSLPAPNKTHGPAGLYLTRNVEAYYSRLRWEELDLPAPDKNVSNYDTRPRSDQDLAPWTDFDLRRLGLADPPGDAPPAPEPPAPPSSPDPSAPGTRKPPPAGALDGITHDLLR